MRTLYLFRHGETDYNREHRFQGHLNIPLNNEGRRQARVLIEPLRRMGIECILSSDLSRAVETATIVASALEIPVHRDAGLREAHLGDAQGLTTDEIEARFGRALVEKWRSPYATDADVSYPGGESGRAVLDRVLASMESFAAGSSAERIGIATHGGVIRRVVRELIGPDAPPVPIPNGILYPLEFDPRAGRSGWRLLPANLLRG